jgi:hypothetical protein
MINGVREVVKPQGDDINCYNSYMATKEDILESSKYSSAIILVCTAALVLIHFAV